MPEFQMFVSYEDGDLDPHLSRYVCANNYAGGNTAAIEQLHVYREALNRANSPYIGLATETCLLDLTSRTSLGESTDSSSNPAFSKTENVDLPILESFGYSEDTPTILSNNSCIVLPKPVSWLNNECMSATHQHVFWYWWHRKSTDLDIFKNVFAEMCPEYLEDLESYRTDNVGFPLGTFIMNRDLFETYSNWMLSAVEKYLRILDQDNNISWVESLAPQMASHHLLALFIMHTKRSSPDVKIEYAACTYFKHMDDPYLKPAFDNNNVAIVLASDACYAPLLSVTIESIIANASSPNNYDLIILDAGLTNADIDFLQQQIAARSNVSLRFLHLHQKLKERGLPTLAHISITTFARFLILDFLAAYSKVLYLDTDLVCTTDIAELYKTDVRDYLIAAVRDTADAGWSNIFDNNTRQHITDIIQLDNVFDYFNAGVIIMNIEALSKITSCDELLKASLDKKWLWMDQDILNHLCAGRVKFLDQSWNYMAHRESYFTPETTPEVWLPIWLKQEYLSARQNPKIVHYAGRATPCFSLYSDLAWHFWKYAKTSPFYEILICTAASEMEEDQLNPVSLARKECIRLSKVGPLVTIIVPVYNAARYLPEMFDSLLRQTHENLEIICINDGSTDNSLAVLNAHAGQDSRIIIVDRKNEGAGSTRNTGMEYVHGKYMCFVDSDDFIEEDAIEQLVYAAEKNETDVVIFGIDQYDDKTGIFSPNPGAVSRSHIPSRKVFFAAYIENFYKHLVGFTVNKFYRSSYLLGLNLRFPLIGAHEDMPFTYIALSAAARSYYLDKTLYHYRRAREGSLSDDTSSKYIYMFDALECFKNDLIERGLWGDYYKNFINYALHMCRWKHEEFDRFDRIEFRDTCRQTWFERLSILGQEESFFYDPDDYRFYKDTMNISPSRKFIAKCYRRKLSRSK